MKSAPLPPDEEARLAALRLYDVLDTPPEQPFDDLAELAAHICAAPIALISLIDEDRQWFKSRVGLDARETTRDIAFCAHAIQQPDLFIVEDAARDARFSDNPLVTAEPHIRFYAGAPLITPEGRALGTLCVIDRQPRSLAPDHQRALRVLSRHVMTQLELRRRDREANELRAERIALIDALREKERGLETQVAARNADLAGLRQEHDRQLMLAEESRRALLSLLEDQQLMENEIRELNTDLEQKVRERTEQLAAANKELETFTYSVSHDLKAPLRGIDGYSRLLQEKYRTGLDEEGSLFLANVRKGVEQMGQLIEDLLSYSRMERRSLKELDLDLGRLIRTILAERQADIEALGMIVALELDELHAHADPDGLGLVLRNLIDNAIKFSRDSQPPRLTIRGQATEKSVILECIDNGIGFSMQFHDRIFEIFQRLQRAEDYPGTGIGLAIVHRAMLRMGGRVWARSTPGEGAAFYLELPK